MDRLFLDANVIFTAAHNSEGKVAFLFAHAASTGTASSNLPWALLSSAYAIEEARRNIAVKYPRAVAAFEGLLPRLAVVPEPASARLSLPLPAKDQPIWSAALASGATHFLIDDLRDFGPHVNRRDASGGVLIQSVADYLAGL